MFKLVLSFAFVTIAFASFEKDCLELHNEYREMHSVPPLYIDKAVQDSAQAYANKLAASGILKHSPGGKYGENLYAATGIWKVAEDAVNSWYDEIEDYKFGEEGFQKKAGHFTQLIWKSSRKLGCALGSRNGDKIFVVAQYSPAGNVIGQFLSNVPKPSDSSKGNSYNHFVALYIIFVLNLFFIFFQ